MTMIARVQELTSRFEFDGLGDLVSYKAARFC